MRFNYESQAPLRAEASQPGLRVTFQEGPGEDSLWLCASTSQTAASIASAERQPEPGLAPVRTLQQEALVGSLAQKGAQARVVMFWGCREALHEGTVKLRPTLLWAMA